MTRLIKILFNVADLVAGLTMIGILLALGRVYFSALDATLSPEGLKPDSVADFLFIWGIFAATVAWAAIGIFSCYLLLQRQIFGLLIMAVQDLIVLAAGALMLASSIFLVFGHTSEILIFLYVFAFRMTLLGLPWYLNYREMKKKLAAEI